MLDSLTLENLDRRKLQIQSRIRNLEERIQQVKRPLTQKHPNFKALPKCKHLSMSLEILSLTIGAPAQQPAQPQPLQGDTKQNAPNLHEMLKKAIERQAHVEEELRGIRSRMPSKDARKEASPAAVDSAPQRYFGATYDLNSGANGSSPMLYSYRQDRSPIQAAVFSADEKDQQSEPEDELLNVEEGGQEDQRDSLSIPQEIFESEHRDSLEPNSTQKISHFKVMTSCRKVNSRDRNMSVSNKNTERNQSSSKFDRFEAQLNSPSNYMEKYIKAIKGRQRTVLIPKFDSLEILEETRSKVIERIETRIVGSMSQQKENTKSGKHEKDSLLSSFDLQKKLRDGLLKKVFEMQDGKKYK